MNITIFRLIIIFILFLLNSFASGVQDSDSSPQAFQELTLSIREGNITKKDAKNKFKELIPLLDRYFTSHGGRNYSSSKWVFPVNGYSPRRAELDKRDFLYRGYDFFVSNRHHDHPAYDLFIRDNNQDCLDDKTGRPVQVLSMTSGVVVAINTNWQTNEDILGGNHVMVYDPGNEALIYYAHNKEVLVKTGAIVKPGDTLAIMGRTGTKAFRKKSPTHVHVMYLSINKGILKPVKIYKKLKQCRVLVKTDQSFTQ